MAYEPDQTRQRIVRAGAELFYGQSIAEVGVDAIAERAGTTKKTLYYHFDNKQNLVKESFAFRAAYVLGLYRALMDENSSARDGISRLFENVGQFASQARTKGCPFVRGAAELAAKPDHPAVAVIRDYKRELAGLIAVRLQADGYDAPERLSRQIMVLYEGAIANVMFHDDPSYVEDALDAAMTLLHRTVP